MFTSLHNVVLASHYFILSKDKGYFKTPKFTALYLQETLVIMYHDVDKSIVVYIHRISS